MPLIQCLSFKASRSRPLVQGLPAMKGCHQQMVLGEGSSLAQHGRASQQRGRTAQDAGVSGGEHGVVAVGGERKGYEYVRVVPRSLPRSFRLAHAPNGTTVKVAATTKWNDISHASRRIPRILTHPTHPDVSHVSHVSHASLPCRALQPQPKCFQRGGPVGLKQTPHRPMGGGGAGSVQFDRGHRHVSFPQRQGVEPVCFGKKVFWKKKCFGQKMFWKKKCFGQTSVLEKKVFWTKKCFGNKVGTSVTKILVEHEKLTVLPPSWGTW